MGFAGDRRGSVVGVENARQACVSVAVKRRRHVNRKHRRRQHRAVNERLKLRASDMRSLIASGELAMKGEIMKRVYRPLRQFILKANGIWRAWRR